MIDKLRFCALFHVLATDLQYVVYICSINNLSALSKYHHLIDGC